MVYVLVALIALGLWLYSLVEVLTTDEADVRLLSKFTWVMLVLLTLIVGAVLWLVLGRPGRGPVPAARRTSAPRGPDDDPEFLRQIERRLRGDD
jgi:phospholipase D-like protein